MIIAAGHVSVIDQRVHDRFFCRLHHACENRIQQIVWNGFDRMCDSSRIGRRSGFAVENAMNKSPEPFPEYAAGAGQAERGATRQTFQLVRQQRRIRRHDDDDRAGFLLL